MTCQSLRSGAWRARLAVLGVVMVALASACVAPLSTPGDTGSIELVSSTTESGYRVEFYRNTAYPCSISGYQTFAIGYHEADALSTPRPLWTFMHGGAVGWFDESGQPQPDESFLHEEDRNTLVAHGTTPGLVARVLDDPADFRILVVSMCNRELYGGADQVDPNNPNLEPDGTARTTNGLFATKAAIQFTRDRFATTKHFLHGTSAGSLGSYGMAWALERQELAPAGIVADSFVANDAWINAVIDQGVSCSTAQNSIAHAAEVRARIHPDLANADNEADRLVSSGRLTVPIAQVWSHGDPWGCGATPIDCPLRDGTTVVLGSTDCMNEPLRRAIAAQGPTSRSASFPTCVDSGCFRHVVTLVDGTNTDPQTPADYNTAIMDWVRERLLD